MDVLRKLQNDFLTDPPAVGTSKTVSVWLVDDNETYRGLLAKELGRREGIRCPRHFPCAQSALRALAEEPAPDVMLLDVNLRGASGLNAIAPLKAVAGRTRVLMLTTFFDHLAEAARVAAGAAGLLLKSYSCNQIAASIREVHEVPSLRVSVAPQPLPDRRVAPEFVPLMERGARLFRTWLAPRERRATADAGVN